MKDIMLKLLEILPKEKKEEVLVKAIEEGIKRFHETKDFNNILAASALILESTLVGELGFDNIKEEEETIKNIKSLMKESKDIFKKKGDKDA